jgi:two-component system, chemotaxis family, sensor kinase CheA
VTYRIFFRPNGRFFLSGDDPLRILRELAKLGKYQVKADVSSIPPLASMDPEASYIAWKLALETRASRADIEEVFAWAVEDSQLSITEGNEQASTRSPMETETQGVGGGDSAVAKEKQEVRVNDRTGLSRANTLQVSTEKVDQLVNLVGELVITQTMLKQCGDRLDESGAEQMHTAIGQLERNTRDLQEAVLAIRMMPVNLLFSRFPRLVRDVSIALDKKVELRVSGEGSELDKTMIEKLFDPLTHLVRNALDHGIEAPEERRRSGKPEVATIWLHAEHKAGSVEIEVRDDGRGINTEKVRAKAVERGLLAADQTDSDDLLRLIFSSGFSTAEQVSDLSGRGVGLDVVRQNILSLGGSIEVNSVAGQGTVFRIRLPLTLAIVDGMFVQVGGASYVVPLTFIVECMQADQKLVRSLSGKGLVVEVRGEYVPIVNLGELLGIEQAASLFDGVLVLVDAEQRRLALLVDNVIGQDQVVIKSLETNYGKVRYLAGATILGDGRVALILDANALARTLGVREPSSKATSQFVLA